jgi:hypothetical protein
MGVSQHVVKQAWPQDGQGRYVYFILVRYPDSLVAEMRRLSKGCKVVTTVAGRDGNFVVVQVAEANYVGAVLSSVDITVTKVNTFALLISFAIWKVPAGSKLTISRSFQPALVRSSAATIRVPVSDSERRFVDLALGAKIDVAAVIKGCDEIGRQVMARVRFW